jgi:hypothetical protein
MRERFKDSIMTIFIAEEKSIESSGLLYHTDSSLELYAVWKKRDL